MESLKLASGNLKLIRFTMFWSDGVERKLRVRTQALSGGKVD